MRPLMRQPNTVRITWTVCIAAVGRQQGRMANIIDAPIYRLLSALYYWITNPNHNTNFNPNPNPNPTNPNRPTILNHLSLFAVLQFGLMTAKM